MLIFILKKGADLGVTVLWIVVTTLAISLVMFFLGKASGNVKIFDIFATVEEPHNFFVVFAIKSTNIDSIIVVIASISASNFLFSSSCFPLGSLRIAFFF